MSEHLRLGLEMSISKRRHAVAATVPQEARPKYIPIWKQDPLNPERVQTPQSFGYEFKETGGEVQLTNEGLGQLYVCFGAPGVGKSFLLLRLLEQLAALNWPTPWGGLLLDPKLTLISDVKRVLPAGRMHVIGPSAGSRTNLLASHLGPRDLGVALALAAQSGGISSDSTYWLSELKRLFGAGLALLKVMERPLTLACLADLFLGTVSIDSKRVPRLQVVVERAQNLELGADDARRRDRAVSELALFTASKGENADTVRSFLSQVLSPFLDPELDYVSDPATSDSIADLIIRDAKWVLLDVPRSALAVSRMLSTLTKVLFQRAILERYLLYPDSARRVFLFVDEYAEVASDLPGEGFGDSIFFSQMRQFRVLSLVATQGTTMLENSGVKEAWKTLLSNSAGKLFFRVGDPDTADLASKLLGEGDVVMTDHGLSHSAGTANVQMGQKLDKKTPLTSDLFLTGLERGDLVFIGTTDGVGKATSRYVRVR